MTQSETVNFTKVINNNFYTCDEEVKAFLKEIEISHDLRDISESDFCELFDNWLYEKQKAMKSA